MVHDLTEEKLFPVLPPEVLDELKRHGTVRELADGEALFREGDVDYPFIAVLSGEIRVLKQIGGDEQLLAIHGPGQFAGEISMLVGAPAFAKAQANGPTTVVSVPLKAFRGFASESLRRTVLGAMTRRSQEMSVFLVQKEKLAALGKLSAGLAHELNNPAAAARRASGNLKESVKQLQMHSIQYDCRFSEPQREALVALQRRLDANRGCLAALDSLERSDREDVLTTWLESHNVPRAWELAPVFTASGLEASDLDKLTAKLGSDNLTGALVWLESTLKVSDIASELESSLTRITDLVLAMKEYSYMDQAALLEIDIHKGLENTLKIFSPKFKSGIEVVLQFDRTLPRICAYAGELNQVWTNLIANAIDAMNGCGRLTIRTARSELGVLVEIGDTGAGIPPEIKSRIFEPFFTTKPAGQGTGLGLDISYRIITSRHRGSITVQSKPGDTRFQVRLPLNPPKTNK